MSALRFKVGEIALIGRPGAAAPVGDEVEIIEVGPFRANHCTTVRGETFSTPHEADYIIHHPATGGWFAVDPDLRKRRPPIPPEVLEQFNVAPVDAVPA